MELEKLTDPPGVIGAPDDVSVTVAVQLVGAFTGTVPGLQLRLADVVRVVTVIVVLPELGEWLGSPP
jgi:hypothetical protein